MRMLPLLSLALGALVAVSPVGTPAVAQTAETAGVITEDRKSTRLNSSH